MPVLTTVLRSRKHKQGQSPLKKFKLKKVSSDSTLDAWLFAEDEETKRLNKQFSNNHKHKVC